MRVLFGLAALAAAVNAQTITISQTGANPQAAQPTGLTATTATVLTGLSATGASLGAPSVDPPLDPTRFLTFQPGVQQNSGSWTIRIPFTVKTIVWSVTTNSAVAQLVYRFSGSQYNADIAAYNIAVPSARLATDYYRCDPCAGGTFGSCNSATGPTPGSAGFNCASFTRVYTLTGLVNGAVGNNFAYKVFDNLVAGVSSYVWQIFQAAPAVLGDPQISGMQGQDFQVHGVPDEVFNMITYPNLQVNARFAYLSSADCIDNYTACFAHPGTYISEEGIRIGSDKIHVRAGSAKKGLTVSVNGQKVVAAKTNVKLGSVEVVNHRRVVIKTPIMSLQITNSDNFLNQETQLYDRKLLALGAERRVLADSEKFHPEVPLHGLQGQTWRNVEYPSGLDYEGSISDYQIQDGNLFGTNFVFNQFSQ